MKRLVPILLIVLLLAGGGGAAWWFLFREAPAEAVEEANQPAVEDATRARRRFVELDPMVLPIIREGQVTLHLTLVLAVELTTPLPVLEVVSLQRPLQDAVLTELHAIYALRYIQEKGFDHPIVRERLFRASERVLGVGAVKALVVRNVGTQVPLKG